MSDDAIRNRILRAARDRFFKFGFSKVTMDELAQDLGMSKKTLYKFFPSKSDLLRQVMAAMQNEVEVGLDRILRDDSRTFVEKWKQLWTFIALEISQIKPPFLEDLKRGAPDLWRDADRRRREIIQATMGKLMKEGMRKKVFRRDIDEQLLLLMFLALVQNVVNPDTLSQLPLSASQAYEAVRKVFFEGILTDQAREEYRDR